MGYSRFLFKQTFIDPQYLQSTAAKQGIGSAPDSLLWGRSIPVLWICNQGIGPGDQPG